MTGAPFNVVLVYVPQQAQILLNKSPLDSGVYLIGYSAVAAAAAALVNFISAKGRIPFIYSLLVGCIVHTVGVGLLSTIASSEGFHATDVGYSVIAGVGIGIILGVLMLCTPYIVEDRDLGTSVSFFSSPCLPILKPERTKKETSSLTDHFANLNSHCNWSCSSIPIPRRCHRTCYCLQYSQRPPVESPAGCIQAPRSPHSTGERGHDQSTGPGFTKRGQGRDRGKLHDTTSGDDWVCCRPAARGAVSIEKRKAAIDGRETGRRLRWMYVIVRSHRWPGVI